MTVKAWRVELDPAFKEDIRRLSQADRIRILKFIQSRLVAQPDPRTLAGRMQGTRRPLWRFRVGDYRIIAEIREKELIVIAISVAHRREVYR